MQPFKTLIVCLCLVLACGCVEKKKDNFDRTALLNNLYSNVIYPDYQAFQNSVAAFQASTDAFLLNADSVRLDSLKATYLNAYKSFQAVEVYSFSIAPDLRSELNTFPPDTSQIGLNIATGSYDLTTVNNIRAKGFPAIDFLLFSKSNSETVADFTSMDRKNYLNDVVQDIREKAAAAAVGWSSFAQEFANASGTDVGSSVAMLVNDLSFAAERNRRERVGNALGYVGVISGGSVVPNAVEAYYNTNSKELLVENLQRLKNLYEGGSGQGFDDYLVGLNADYNGTPLATEISNQFDRVILSAQNVPVAFSSAVTTHNAEMQTLFLELKKLTVLLKVDISSNLGVIINYSDNDGD
ncbi:MAG: imelysin family protein [Bacteroidetes bacterium]|nr:imelysin family protein [Bacteroidota bacterium]